jgi:hypothetical protein
MANSKERRKLRRMLKEAGLLPPPPPPAQPPSNGMKEKYPAWWRRIPKWIYAGIAGTAAVVGLLVLYPWLSIELSSPSDSSNPFTENFNVVNEGFISAMNVSAYCTRDADFGIGVTLRGVHEEDSRTILSPSLDYKRKVTIPCTPEEMIKGMPPIRSANLTISVWYAVGWLPLQRQQDFKFRLTRDVGGQYRWLYGG